MQNLNLKQLEVFVTVVEEGSFTAAAEHLYLAQSTVSGHISALEKEMGLTLLLRTGKRKVKGNYSTSPHSGAGCGEPSPQMRSIMASHLSCPCRISMWMRRK